MGYRKYEIEYQQYQEAKKLLIESAGRAAELIKDGPPRSNSSPEEVYNEANEIESAMDRVLQLLGMEE